ncbi:MAG TPA: divalent-cation tolerance protein CutA [Candidatus Acidoferrum sp.]|nr:divalent-cation tolerance protein CutA [Candidatus Acidoferrum sp.]
MAASKTIRVVLVTCGNLVEARRIARKVVGRRLAACATIVLGPVQSVYRWKGKVEVSREQLVLIKTVEKQLPALEAEIKRLHSYEVPEILALPAAWASPDYLKWLKANSGL